MKRLTSSSFSDALNTTTEVFFLLLAPMALARIKSMEQLRYVAPEWGTRLGWDRIPEVRTRRQKLEFLCQQAASDSLEYSTGPGVDRGAMRKRADLLYRRTRAGL
jgi:hypothetical protein